MLRPICYVLLFVIFSSLSSIPIYAFPNSFGSDRKPKTSDKQKINQLATKITTSKSISHWPHVGGTAQGGHYISDSQINLNNIKTLDVAWTHRSGDFRQGDNFIDGISGEKPLQTGFQATPIHYNNALFYCTPYNRVISLNPENGKVIWAYDPQVDLSKFGVPRCRGVSSWTNPALNEEAKCKYMIFAPTMDARIIALDATSGEKCNNFADNGEIILTDGLGDYNPSDYSLTTPPLITSTLLVTGSAVADNISTDVPSGVVRAYDLQTGLLAWAWDTIPPNSKPILNSESKEAYQRGTTNVWSFISADDELGLVYVPTGNTSPDYYGGHRNGSDYYSSSIVALSQITGEVKWHFRAVNHDIWDFDIPSQPTLYDFMFNGKIVRALAQTTKMGHVFLLNRETGEPIFPVEDKPVPQGAIFGDYTAPTQPFPTKPKSLMNLDFNEDDIWGLTPFDRGACRKKFKELKYEGIYTPSSEEGSIHFPGSFGGHNWGGPALDPVNKKLIVNTLHMASIVKLIPREKCGQAEVDRQKKRLDRRFSFIEPSKGTPFCNQRWLGFFSPLAIPCTPPPWGTLASIDLISGDVDWQVPLGTTRDLAPFPVWFIKGVPNIGGPLVTDTGLIFIAATTDFYIRGFDLNSGDVVWKHRLPTAAHASPMSYISQNNEQYIVVAAGGSPVLATPPGDYVIAYKISKDK